jgi:surface antigen/phage tail protein X
LAAALPWLAVHAPIGPATALAKDRTVVAATPPRSTDHSGWSADGFMVKPQLSMTPAGVDEQRRPILTYRASDGDTLRALAASYGLTVNTLIWSNAGAVDELQHGQVVMIPPVDGVLVRVERGDTVAELARKYRAEVDAIIEFNLLRHPEDLTAGNWLMIPFGVGPEAGPVPAANPRSVMAGGRAVWITPVWSGGGSGYPFGQCTWYVNTRRPAPWGGNAWEWYGRARAWGRPEGPAPRVGAIMVTWESPYWGHVAYVEKVNSDGSWLVSEMNYYSDGGGWGRIDYRRVVPGSIPLIGFIY